MNKTETIYGTYVHGPVIYRTDVFPNGLYRYDLFNPIHAATTRPGSTFVMAADKDDDSEIYLWSQLPEGAEHKPCECCLMGIVHTHRKHEGGCL